MANEKQPRDADGQFAARKRDRIVDGVKSRPYTAAAVATLAGAAGAAAYFLTRERSDKPLMNWDREAGDGKAGAGAFKPEISSEIKRSAPDGMTSGRSSESLSRTSGAKGNSGLDETSADPIKTGAISYGA